MSGYYRRPNKYERAYLRRVQRIQKRRSSSFKKRSVLQKSISWLQKKSLRVFAKTILLLRRIIRFIKKTKNQIISSFALAWKKVFQKIANEKKILVNYMKQQKKEVTVKKVTKTKKVLKKKSSLKEKKLDGLKKPKKTKKRKNIFLTWMKRLFFVFLILALLGGAALFAWFSSLEIPSVENFDQRKISNSTKLYDKTGEILLYDIHENIQRTVVQSDKISQSAKDAIVAIEDHTFYEHKGVVWKSTFRAIAQTLLSKMGIPAGGTAGGSTLTQQVIKNTLLTREKTITRKMKEWVLAYKIEKKLDKDQILTVYLNEAPYGGTIYGIEEASRVFFGKTAAELSIAESAYLAAIPNLPTYYSPYGPNKDKLDRRQRIVLSEMKKYGFISDTQYRKALEEQVKFRGQEEDHAKALHFVQYVRSLLEEKYGADMVENGGLQVITSLDYKLQQKAEKIIKDHVDNVKDQYDATNASLVAIEAETGNIITMVGSRDYFDTDEFDGNFNVAISPRQPGSSFKPFAYAAAFEKGYLPESMIFDSETQFNSRCAPDDRTSKNGCYSPNNHDFKFDGAMNFRNALAQSRNIPAIKISYLAGLSNVIKRAQEMGISSLKKPADHYGLGLVLGGGEVSLLEMVSAYTTFANDGDYVPSNAILKITDVDGKILQEHKVVEERVFSKNTARMISSILSDNAARAPLFGWQSFLYFGKKDVAGKTGTTNDNRDAWLIGYNPEVAVGVWTGNNDNSSMKKGSSISGKPWREFMEEVLDEYGNSKFKEYEKPENFETLPNMIRGEWFGGETYYIDSVSGKLATEFTPEETKISVTNFDPHTILYSVDKNKPQEPGNSQSDPQFKNWEFSVKEYSKEKYADLYVEPADIPTEYDDVHTADGIVQEANFEFDIDGVDKEYKSDDILEFDIDLDGIKKRDVSGVLYYINNKFIGSVEDSPFRFKIELSDIKNLSETNVLNVFVEDEDGRKVSRSVNFKITDSEASLSLDSE